MKLKDRQNNETFLGSCNRVSIGMEHNGKCSIKKCRCRKVFMVFVDDGCPKMSRYSGSFCRKHLYLAVNKGWEYNNRRWRKKKK